MDKNWFAKSLMVQMSHSSNLQVLWQRQSYRKDEIFQKDWHCWHACDAAECCCALDNSVVINPFAVALLICKTSSPAVARIADRTGCQWPSKSSKVNNLQLIWKPICDFLLVINNNLGRISHRFWDMVSFPLKTHIFTPFIQPPIWKCSPCTRWLKFCNPEFNTHG